MKPKVKVGMKPHTLKKESTEHRQMIPAPPLAEASVAKQKKQKKLLQAKLKKRAAQMSAAEAASSTAPVPHHQLLQLQQKKPKFKKGKSVPVERPKQEKIQPKMDKMEPLSEDADQSQQHRQQTMKRKLLKAQDADKRPRIEANGGSRPDQPKGGTPPQSASERPDYLADTGPVRDPVLRAAIAACLRRRAACTVRVRQLPNRLRMPQITALCQGVQAARVPWNYATGRNKGVAFLEFASPEAAKRGVAEIAASKSLGIRLTASIRDADDAEGDADVDNDIDIDSFNCRRVVVSSLHPHTTGQELKDLVGGSAVLRVDFLQGSKLLRKHAPAVAFLTFADERRALDAINTFQGRVIRGRGTSWLLQKRSERPEHSRHPTQLVAFGVSKRVSDEDILKAFPNSLNIDVRQAHGMAIVSYAGEEECRADYEACKGGVVRVGKACKLRVQYGHAQYKPLSQRRAAAAVRAASQPAPEPRRQPQPPPKPLNIDPSLFNKCQLVLKNFKPATQESDLSGFLSGVRRVFFTPNHRLAFAHFTSESSAAAALEKLSREPLNGAKLKAMYAMDKPDKMANRKQQLLEQQQQPPQQEQQQQEDVSMTDVNSDQKPQLKQKKNLKQKQKIQSSTAEKQQPQEEEKKKTTFKKAKNVFNKMRPGKPIKGAARTGAV